MKIFIGSSTEAIKRDVVSNLAYWIEAANHEPIRWDKPGLFLGRYIFSRLLEIAREVDAAILVFSEDDRVWYRESLLSQPRDNVVLEYGLFAGVLGTAKVIVARESEAKNPSDLAGIIYLDMSPGSQNRARAELDMWMKSAEAPQLPLPESEGRPEDESRIKEALSNLMQVAARLSALRANLDVNQVRAFCHLYNKDLRKLIPYVMYTGIRIHNDATVPIPCSGTSSQEDWFVISKAFRKNTYCCENVDWSANPDEIEVARRIWRDVKAIAGHPIRPRDRDSDPIGTVCCDSSKTAQEIGWANDAELEDILALIADTVYKVLRG